MKTGKFIPLGCYNDVKIGYGTVDYKNLKSIFLKLNSWIEPADEGDYDSEISKSRKRIKDFIYNDKNDYFRKQCLVDLDIRTKGIKTNKRSFMSLEITLYVENHFDVKSKEIKETIKEMIKKIIDHTLTNKDLYNFNTKKID